MVGAIWFLKESHKVQLRFASYNMKAIHKSHKILSKLKKDKVDIIFPQDTQLHC